MAGHKYPYLQFEEVEVDGKNRRKVESLETGVYIPRRTTAKARRKRKTSGTTSNVIKKKESKATLKQQPHSFPPCPFQKSHKIY